QRHRAAVQARQRLAVRRRALVPSHVRDLHRHRLPGHEIAAGGAPPMSFFKSRIPLAPLEYTKRLWMRAWVGLVLFFLYAPLITLIAFSFNDSRRNIVWRGFTLKYYEKALDNDSLMIAMGNSLTIAFISTIVSVVIGALAAV